MIYTALLRSVFDRLHGPCPEARCGADSGLVLVADGIGGFDLCATGLRYAAAHAGLPHEVRHVAWGHGWGRWHKDLTTPANVAKWAASVAEQVADFKDEHPDAPVYLIGKSGGTYVMVQALEALPDDTVEATVLLAPAISPSYDLTRALRGVRSQMVVHHSPLDFILLGIGTRMFKTIDRVRAPGSGLNGFRRPEGLGAEGEAQYAKLKQVRWSPSMARAWYFGGHVGVDHPKFLAHYVLPLIRTDTPRNGREADSIPEPAGHSSGANGSAGKAGS